jgi:KipI family sensor histidine kinase inhibitor
MSSGLRILPCGERAVLVELAELADELVPGARTLLVMFDPHVTSVERLGDQLGRVARAAPEPVAEAGSAPTEIPTVYDGADLGEVAELTGLDPREVVERHTAAGYTVAFCGFSPGFGYLTGGDQALRVPRRETPRTKVPAGAVAIADAFTGVYPRELPGGWRLLGRTSLPMWDLARDPPAVLVPGSRVRFVEVTP